MREGPNRIPNRIERILGRSVAAFVHPCAAWRFGTVPVRIWLVFAYFSGSYLTVFCALELLRA
jgi:hypothetical protein